MIAKRFSAYFSFQCMVQIGSKMLCVKRNYHEAIVGFDFGSDDDDELENDHLIICRLLASSALVYKFTNSIISLKPDNPYLHRTHTL